MNANTISRGIRLVIGTLLCIASVMGCIISFREGDDQTGYILIFVIGFALVYLYAVVTGKTWFGKI